MVLQPLLKLVLVLLVLVLLVLVLLVLVQVLVLLHLSIQTGTNMMTGISSCGHSAIEKLYT
jgi:hypothetical protein